MEVGRCNLGFPYTFSESLGPTEHCYVFGFVGTRQSLSCQTFKDSVLRLLAALAPYEVGVEGIDELGILEAAPQSAPWP